MWERLGSNGREKKKMEPVNTKVQIIFGGQVNSPLFDVGGSKNANIQCRQHIHKTVGSDLVLCVGAAVRDLESTDTCARKKQSIQTDLSRHSVNEPLFLWKKTNQTKPKFLST